MTAGAAQYSKLMEHTYYKCTILTVVITITSYEVLSYLRYFTGVCYNIIRTSICICTVTGLLVAPAGLWAGRVGLFFFNASAPQLYYDINIIVF